MSALAYFPNAPPTSEVTRESTCRPPSSQVRSSRLLGRDLEIAAVERLFELGIRLVTVVGAPGIGKTALARAILDRSEMANALHPEHEFLRVALGAARDDDHALEIIAQVMDLRGPADSHARAPQLVLIDDVEHVTVASSSFALALIAADPDTLVLVTSRVALGVAGEHLFELGPLLTRDPDGSPRLLLRWCLRAPLRGARSRFGLPSSARRSNGSLPVSTACHSRSRRSPHVFARSTSPTWSLRSRAPSSCSRRWSHRSLPVMARWRAHSPSAEAVLELRATPTSARLLGLRDEHLLQVTPSGDAGSPAFSMYAVTRAFVRSRDDEVR